MAIDMTGYNTKFDSIKDKMQALGSDIQDLPRTLTAIDNGMDSISGGGGDGYVRVVGVPNGEEIIANAPDIEQGGIIYKPLYYLCGRDINNNNITFTKTGFGVSTGADAYVFSDEPTTLYVGTSVSHTFDTSLDFSTIDGWKCRYVIAYATETNKANVNGINVDLFKYIATFELIGATGTILSSSTPLFGSGGNNGIEYINIENCSIYNDTISVNYFCYSCKVLKEIKMPITLTTISGGYFMQNCASLVEIQWDNILIFSAYQALMSCSSLKSISLENVTTIGAVFCATCNSIKYVNIPNIFTISTTQLFNSAYVLKYIDLSNMDTSTVMIANGLLYVSFIKLPTEYDATCNFTGSTGYSKSIEWLNNEFPNKLKDNSGTTAKTATLGATNISLMTQATLDIIEQKNWTLA